MRDYLARHGFEPVMAGSGEEAVTTFGQSETDLVVVDYRLPGIDGLSTIRELKQLAAHTEVVMLTAHGTVKTAVEAMRAGAFDYLTKPVDLEELSVVLDKAWSHACLRREVHFLKQGEHARDARERIVGDSEATRTLRRQIERLAALDQGPGAAPAILITGETGTGKGLVARTIHDLGPRAARSFIEINCAAIPATLLESEMFGHERGAFTDAKAAKPGLFEAADGGTLFLDEIGAMPLDLQVKLLKVIDERSVRRLGGLRAKTLDLRVIAATNLDLDQAVRDGVFRPDLLYRLNVLKVALVPLRDRPEDIVPLAHHFVTHFARRYARPRRLEPAAEEELSRYQWPGNVRELANVIERVILLQEREDIGAGELGLSARVPGTSGSTSARDRNGVHVDFSRGGVSLAEIERRLIVDALKAARGNRRRAAELLDISFDTLRYRIEKYGLGPRQSTEPR
jgi:DNA-binding NtrC family response regulator